MDDKFQQPTTAPEPLSGQQPSMPTDSTTPPNPQQPAKPHSKKRSWIIGISTAVVATAIVVGGIWFFIQSTVKQSAPNIKVGVMMAFSGGSSSMGYGAMKGVQLAKKQLGADNIEIIQADSKCDPKVAAEVVKDLIAQKVAAIIGEGCSSATIAAIPAANNAKIPIISPSASSTALSIPNDYFFRVVPSDIYQGSFMAQAIYDRGIRNVAIFYTNEPYGTSMNTVFREKFESLGGKVVATEYGEPDVIDLGTQMKAIAAANPQALFIAPNSVVSATAALKLFRENGSKAPIFGADIMYNDTIISNAPVMSEGLTISSFNTGTKAFKQALFNEYQKTEQLYAAPQAYDIIHILQIATQKGAKTGEEIKNLLPSITIDGVSGFKKFDANGEVSDKDYKYDLYVVKDGAFVLVEQ